ncbi:MAG: type II restriction/modification system DNA methylase subunit YeeA [Pseudohongiellaceae bacterium]|jgi:type II restriction/modification system DNA methylase subunit YeeA
MNTSNIKRYAPIARKDFIAAITKQAEKYGISAKAIAPMEIKGDLALIAGKPFPAAIASPRNALVKTVEQQGFNQTIEQVAYSWFNRLCAIRYMELHDYLGHGRRVLSHPEHATGYQILDDCLDIVIPGLDQALVRELKLDGTKDEQLYRELLLAQCHALHTAMPFLFEAVNDQTELLLPENLTKTDSLIHDLVTEIPEEDWQSVEIIGWLYQFYISEKKDQVIGKVVKSEDIPAATQLFTPNWIVKYMVQNSLGAQWLATYPQSPLKGQMDYYIEPAEQTDEVNAQLAAITPSQLNPEALTLIDPASGSGHILVEAYDLFKAIYLERGYRQRDVPRLILEKNLFGLDIDERAAQLTGFALMMKGRADDRRLFERGVKLNVMALADSAGFDAEALAKGVALSDYDLRPGDLTELKQLFEHATTFGSLIQLPEGLAKKLPALKKLSEATSQDLFVSEARKRLRPLVQQAELLAAQFDAVVANPPYMGSGGMNAQVKKFAKDNFPSSKSDLFAVSTERFLEFVKPAGSAGFMTPFTWMFLKSYELLRELLLETKTLNSLIQPEYHAFFESAYVPVCTFTVRNSHTTGYDASFIKLSDFYGADLQPQKTLEAISNPDCEWLYRAKPDEFKTIPGKPIAYWLSPTITGMFGTTEPLGEVCDPKVGIMTSDNDKYLRRFWEVASGRTLLCATSVEVVDNQAPQWVPHNKGGSFRKWYGNQDFLINWLGYAHQFKDRYRNHFFQECISWSEITSSALSFRYFPHGFTFNIKGMSAFGSGKYSIPELLCVANSNITNHISRAINPTLSFGANNFRAIPALAHGHAGESDIANTLIRFSKTDWDSFETSWDFQSLPLLKASSEPTPTLESSYTVWITQNRDTIAEMKRLEEENNRLFIDAYGLADELTSDVPIEQITLTVNPAYRYGGKLTEEQLWARFREDSMQELVSYAIGCMMGRYSLDAPGLIYAHSGNEGFDASRYTTFPADDDGIVPITDKEWFSDDAANRVEEFIAVAWDKAALEQNLAFLADNLFPKKGEGPRDTLRRYLSDAFFKDHMKTYKKRPIYWLFSSGKQKSFQCLVYLHRYNEGTLARMRTEYVIPLTAKMSAHVQKIEKDIETSDSAAEIKRLEKEIAKLHKQQAELSEFDEKLRHYADMRISLDLDDGVKVNYGRFGDLLSDVKAITGEAPEVIA